MGTFGGIVKKAVFHLGCLMPLSIAGLLSANLAQFFGGDGGINHMGMSTLNFIGACQYMQELGTKNWKN